MSEILWQPGPEQIQRSFLSRFQAGVNEARSLDLDSYSDLHTWSVQHLTDFWEHYRNWSDLKFHQPPAEILSSFRMPGARWFEGAELNYAENLLRGPPDQPAILAKGEDGPIVRISYRELQDAAVRFATALKRVGVKPGDRVAGYLPNIPETVIAMLGSAAIGAVWTSCSPDFGPQGIRDRFGQIEPRVLVFADGYTYNGKPHTVVDTVNRLSEDLKGMEHIVVVPSLDRDFRKTHVQFSSVFLWDEFLDMGYTDGFRFEPFPFNHPLCILYSSGTTGFPKCIVHGAGGTLLQHHKEHALHTGIGPGDVVFYYTTCGWMMWNWLVSALARKATLVLYEGSPAYPSMNVLWELIDEAGINIFGTSPKFLSINSKQNLQPCNVAGLRSLKVMLSTGAPLDADLFRWVYRSVKPDLQLSSISGGTDIISCFMLGNPNLPVRAGEIQCIGLGMDVVALDESGKSVKNHKGELACRQPTPSMPLNFWCDPADRKYIQTYFSKFPGIWVHGDYIEVRDHGGVVVYGRSDATLKPGGVRIGTAEIYRIVEQMDSVLDSLVIGVEEEGDIRLFLFVVLRAGCTLGEEMQQEIRNRIRSEATPRHVPHLIYSVKDIPRTLNGKKCELTVRSIFCEEEVTNTGALANPECLVEYEEIRDTHMTVGKREVDSKINSK